MSQGRSSGVRLIVRPGRFATLALPVPRQACLGLARAVLAAASGVSASSVELPGDLLRESRAQAPSAVTPRSSTWPWLSSAEASVAELLGGAPLRQRRVEPGSTPNASGPGLVTVAGDAARGIAPSVAGLSGTGTGAEAEALVYLWGRLLSFDGAEEARDGNPTRADGAMWARIRPGARRPGSVPLVSFARDLMSGPLSGDGMDVEESAWSAWIAQGPAEADPASQGEVWADRLRAGDLPVSRIPSPHALSVEGGELLGTVRLAAHHVHLALSFEDALGEARLEAMRELAYGAGHEINNPLANIATRAQTLLLDERDPERRRRLSTIVDQAFRARDLIGGLMLFARPPRPHRVATDIHEMVSTVIDRLAPLAAQRLARLDYGPAPAPVSVAVDRSQVEEAIRAVVSNALEAVGEGGRVTVSVAAGRTQGDCDLIVSDDGPGIDSTTLRRVFDPFFSGREAGRGAGLGLSKAWRFLEVNGGTIEIESRGGRGTRVLIRLPLAERRVAAPVVVSETLSNDRPPMKDQPFFPMPPNRPG